MNLFIASWNCGPAERARARDAVLAMHDTYPLLDPSTADSWSGRRGFAAWMHTSHHAAGVRRYVHASSRELVLFDGTAVDPAGGITAHEAGDLGKNWTEIGGRLEGKYAAVRFDLEGESLELVNDPFGIHPLFVAHRDASWWISNSVRLIARAAGLAALDMVGLATNIGLNWPGGDRTLVEGVSAVPAAQRWSWLGEGAPRQACYWPLEGLAKTPRRSFGAREAAALADDMGDAIERLSDAFAPLRCPITAGRDSRVLTGLMMARDLPGSFFTAGDGDNPDVVYGTAIADRFGLPHRRSTAPVVDLAAAWDEVSRRVVRKNDGMVTLMHASNALVVPDGLDDLEVQLYGAAGELGRGKRLSTAFVTRRPQLRDARAVVGRVFDHGASFLRPEARQAVRDHLDRTCDVLEGHGFAPVDIPDAFDLSEYGRRWGGAQARQVADRADVFLPFFTRPYMTAAFATPPSERLLERVPYLVLEHLSPELRKMPLADPWPPSSMAALLIRDGFGVPRKLLDKAVRRIGRRRPVPAGRKRDRIDVLERRLPELRARILDDRDAQLWQIVDMARFESITSDRAAPSERVTHLVPLYQVLTAFAFVEDFRDWSAVDGVRRVANAATLSES